MGAGRGRKQPTCAPGAAVHGCLNLTQGKLANQPDHAPVRCGGSSSCSGTSCTSMPFLPLHFSPAFAHLHSSHCHPHTAQPQHPFRHASAMAAAPDTPGGAANFLRWLQFRVSGSTFECPSVYQLVRPIGKGGDLCSPRQPSCRRRHRPAASRCCCQLLPLPCGALNVLLHFDEQKSASSHATTIPDTAAQLLPPAAPAGPTLPPPPARPLRCSLRDRVRRGGHPHQHPGGHQAHRRHLQQPAGCTPHPARDPGGCAGQGTRAGLAAGQAGPGEGQSRAGCWLSAPGCWHVLH